MPDTDRALRDLVLRLDHLSSYLEKAFSRKGTRFWSHTGWTPHDLTALDIIYHEAGRLGDRMVANNSPLGDRLTLYRLDRNGVKSYTLPPHQSGGEVLPMQECERCDRTVKALREVLVSCVTNARIRKELKAVPVACPHDSVSDSPPWDWRWEGLDESLHSVADALRHVKTMAAADLEKKIEWPLPDLLDEACMEERWKTWVETFIGHDSGIYWLRGK